MYSQIRRISVANPNGSRFFNEQEYEPTAPAENAGSPTGGGNNQIGINPVVRPPDPTLGTGAKPWENAGGGAEVPPVLNNPGPEVTRVGQTSTQPSVPTTPTRIPVEAPSATATPARPSEPSPIAMQPPKPFTPLSGPSVSQMVQPISRNVPGTAQGPNSTLLGKAGGLLGGGLSVPGTFQAGTGQDISGLINVLLSKLGKG